MKAELTEDEIDIEAAQLLERLRTERTGELADLFTALRPQLKAMIDARIRGRLVARIDSSDVIQEVFIRANRNLENYLNDPKFSPAVWLRVLGKQVLTEAMRYHLRAKRTPGKEIDHDRSSILSNLLSRSLSGKSRIEKAELTARVHELLETMPHMDREILEMRHVEGRSIQEAAEFLGIQKETAKKRYHRALKRFREVCEALNLA